MRRLLLAILVLLGMKVYAANAEDLIGTWTIFNSSNQAIDTIDISVVVTKKNSSRFSYTQGSHQNIKENSLQGFLFGDYMVFDLINLGFAQTYIAEIDFDIDAGPGVEIKTQLADCTVVGIDEDLVKKKFRNRLAVDSARCDASSFFNSELADIKLVKSGTDVNLVPTNNQPSEAISDKEQRHQNRVEGVWSLSGISPNIKRRIVIKDIAAHHLGYSFTYRLLNNRTRLGNISGADFETGDRQGFVVNNYMMINTSRFDKPNELFLLKLNSNTLKSGSGKELRANNGDCFPLKVPVTDVQVCTPNDSSSRTANVVKRIGRRTGTKVDTNFTIDF